MSVLSGPEIKRLVERTARLKKAARENNTPWPPGDEFCPLLEITPFTPEHVGPNSYDVRLGDRLLTYQGIGEYSENYVVLDCRKDNPTVEHIIPDEGIVLEPGRLYLGSTVERTWCAGLTPWCDGRSSVGRLGMQIHMTAGRGDDGFGGHVEGGCAWTLEIAVVHPLRVYANMRVGQLTFFTLQGKRQAYTGKYTQQTNPTASRLWMDDKENT